MRTSQLTAIDSFSAASYMKPSEGVNLNATTVYDQAFEPRTVSGDYTS